MSTITKVTNPDLLNVVTKNKKSETISFSKVPLPTEVALKVIQKYNGNSKLNLKNLNVTSLKDAREALENAETHDVRNKWLGCIATAIHVALIVSSVAFIGLSYAFWSVSTIIDIGANYGMGFLIGHTALSIANGIGNKQNPLWHLFGLGWARMAFTNVDNKKMALDEVSKAIKEHVSFLTSEDAKNTLTKIANDIQALEKLTIPDMQKIKKEKLAELKIAQKQLSEAIDYFKSKKITGVAN